LRQPGTAISPLLISDVITIRSPGPPQVRRLRRRLQALRLGHASSADPEGRDVTASRKAAWGLRPARRGYGPPRPRAPPGGAGGARPAHCDPRPTDARLPARPAERVLSPGSPRTSARRLMGAPSGAASRGLSRTGQRYKIFPPRSRRSGRPRRSTRRISRARRRLAQRPWASPICRARRGS